MTKKITTRGLSFSDIGGVENGRSEIQVLRTGTRKHPSYGEFSISEADLDQFIQNFKENKRGVDICVDVDHDPGHKAVGRYKDLYKKGTNAVFAVVEWTNQWLELLKDKTYRYFSPELHFEFQDEMTGETIRNLLVGGGITNRPFFKGMQALTMSEQSNDTDNNLYIFYNTSTMPKTFAEIVADLSSKDKLTREELDTARLAFTQLDEAGQANHTVDIANLEKKFTEEEAGDADADTNVTDPAATDGTDPVAPAATDPTDPAPAADPTPTPATPSEFKDPEDANAFNETLKAATGMTLDEVKEVQKKFSEMATAMKKENIAKQFSEVIYSEANKSGTILPKAKDQLMAFAEKLPDNLVGEFLNIVKTWVRTVAFNEIGHGKDVTAAKANEFSVPANTPAGVSRDSYVLATVAKQFSDKEGIDLGSATLKAADYIKANNIK